MDNDTLNLLSKIDTFIFNYTEEVGSIDGYIVGKSIEDRKERFISRVSINPNSPEEFESILDLDCSVEERTLIMDQRLLNDEIVEVLKRAYQEGKIAGIRVIPSEEPLSLEVFNRFNNEDFYGFLIATHSLSEDIKERSNTLDIREQKGLCEIEHIVYNNGEEQDHFNIHITRKLEREELHELCLLIKQHNYQNIFVDFYEPSYYKDLLEALKEEGIREDITINFLGNPLYDELTCYEGLGKIVNNPIRMNYNTCNDLNAFYREEPHTEAVRYYSDIEASGITDVDNYYEMMKMLDEIVEYMEEKNYSPLERIAYLNDYFKNNFIYDPDYETTEHADNAYLDRVYRKDRMICEGFSNLYSAILRRSGILCFTYGTDDHQKNIVRVVDEKYGVDNLAIIDPTFDLSAENNRNVFANFLVPIDNDLFAYVEDSFGGDVAAPSVINIPTALSMGTEYYNAFIGDSNPVYATDPIGYAMRMLQLMGLGEPDMEMTGMERVEFYKSALSRSGLTNKIPYEKIAEAVHSVREQEHEYGDEAESDEDLREIESALSSRGFRHIYDPKIRLFDGTPIDVSLYNPSVQVDFVNRTPQPMIYKRPRKRNENETEEEFSRYLHEFYDTMFYRRYEETVDMSKPREEVEELEEFEFVEDTKTQAPREVEEIVIYRDMDDLGRTFVTEDILRKFHIRIPAYKLVLDTKVEIYEIKPQEAIYIIEHANNPYDPYTIRFQNFDFDNELFDSYQNADKKTKENAPEEIQIFRDIEDSARAFVTKEVLDRFHLEVPNRKVLLGNITVYEIESAQAINIINNANNPYAPYSIRYISIKFDPVIPYKDELSTVVERPMPYNDHLSTVVERPMPYNDGLSTVVERPMPYNDGLSTVVERPMPYQEHLSTVVERPMPYQENLSTVKDETLIPGTNYKKPRVRKPHETDEHYVAYLEGYYDSIFGEEEEAMPYQEELSTVQEDNLIPGTNFEKPRVRGVHETDDEYVDYLEEYYNSIFGKEEEENLSSQRLIRQRPRRTDESDDDYLEYLAMFYGTPVEEKSSGRRK